MNVDLDGRGAYAYTGGKPLDTTLPGVVFVHGALHDHSVWILQSRYLAHHGRAVLAVDLPAHGRSGGTPLGVEAAGQWIARLVEASGVQRTALVGHSMGSLIALEAAARLGARASALIMVGTAYPMKVSPKLLELCQRDVLAAIDLVNALSNSTHAAKPSHPGPGFSIHGSNRALMRRMQRGYAGGNLFMADFSACDAYGGLAATAPRVQCPATLVLGSRDQMTLPQAVAPLVETLKPRVVTLPAGHNLMAEAPDGLLAAINDALQQERAR
ncbi:MAG TPA: alpha/beta hydrolase [Burkholderiaceae bacterium]|nr:alpha/beta hydrolase [Burkholderiaceae bacterium]